MRRQIVAVGILVLALVAFAAPATAGRDEPDVVVVQHVLISFKGKIPGKQIERTKKEAQALAEELLSRANSGEDFDELVKQYTDDRYPGIYKMANRGLPSPPDGFSREKMAPRFGDVSFRLRVGEIGLADYHATLCPYGWHLIKRLE